MKNWEAKVLQAAGAPERVGAIEDELRLAAGLTALREQAGLSQRALAKLIGISQPRVVAIERSRNVTVEVLEQYAKAVGGTLEVSVVKAGQRVSLLSFAGGRAEPRSRAQAIAAPRPAPRSGRQGGAKPSRGSSATAAVTKGRTTGLARAQHPVTSSSSDLPARGPKSKARTALGPSS
jgi:transcriptional regulator with XRE-family HTH domain